MLCGWVIGAVQVVAQSGTATAAFSSDRQEFLKQLEKMFNATSNKDCIETYKDFKAAVDRNVFTEEQFGLLVGLANDMQTRKMPVIPYYRNYLAALTAVVSSTNAAKHYNEWVDASSKLLTGLDKNKQLVFDDFMRYSVRLFTQNALYYVENAHSWRPTSSDFDLAYHQQRVEIRFRATDIVGFRGDDSIRIEDTRGVFYPLEGRWIGDKGRVGFKRTGIRDEAYVTFGRYEVNMKGLEYKVDSAVLHMPSILPQPVQGVFADRIEVITTSYKGTYPRFETYQKILRIKNLGDNLDYQGGFRLEGAKIEGYGDEENPAVVRLYDVNRRLAAILRANSFNIRRGEQLLAASAEVSMYFGLDSIYHPNVSVKYTFKDRRLKISRGDKGSSRTPFFNSHHMVEMYVNSLEWQIDRDILEVGNSQVGFSDAQVATVSYTHLTLPTKA
jgi:hypothetical protein